MIPNAILIPLLAATAVATLGLSMLVYFLGRRAPSNMLFSTWMLGLSTWVISLILFFTASSSVTALFAMRSAYASAIIAIVMFFYFAIQFPRPVPMRKWVHYLHAVALMVFVIVILSTSFLVESVGVAPYYEHIRITFVGWWSYAVYLILFFLFANVLLIKKMWYAKGKEKVRLRFIVYSVFIGGDIFGVLFNLILPSPYFNEWRFIWIGPFATAAVIVPFVTYAVAKHNLFNFRGVVTEVLIFFAIAFVVVDAVISSTMSGFFYRAIVAALLLVVGWRTLHTRAREEREHRRSLKRFSHDLKKAHRDLGELDRLKGEFISIASHQLRTPASIMRGYLDLFGDDAYGNVLPEMRERVQIMTRANDHLIQLINNMVHVARIERGGIEYEKERVNITDLIYDIAGRLEHRSDTKNIALIVDFNDVMILNTDKEKVEVVFTNLIDNAIKYTNKGSITISAHELKEKNLIEISIKDTGIGISGKNKKKIFKKFFRPDTETNTLTQGMGLGLYLSETFLIGMGGSIKIESNPDGHGTQVVCTLPLG